MTGRYRLTRRGRFVRDAVILLVNSLCIGATVVLGAFLTYIYWF